MNTDMTMIDHAAPDAPPRLLALLREDVRCVFGRDPAARTAWEVLTTYPGVHAVLAHRVAHALWRRGWRYPARLVSFIRGRMAQPARSLAGELVLAELAALVREADLLVTNNTGPAHIAAAVGTPVVDLYALTNPQHTPWQVRSRVLFHDVPCRYCYKSECPAGHHDCLRGVPPETVAAAACELLAPC